MLDSRSLCGFQVRLSTTARRIIMKCRLLRDEVAGTAEVGVEQLGSNQSDSERRRGHITAYQQPASPQTLQRTCG